MALAIIDDFTRANETPLSQGGNWVGPTIDSTVFGSQPNPANLESNLCVADLSDPDLLGSVDAGSYRTDVNEANVEVAARIAVIGAYSGPAVTARIQNGGTDTAQAYALFVAGDSELDLYVLDGVGGYNFIDSFFPDDPLLVGDWFKLRANGNKFTVSIQRGGATPDGTWEPLGASIDETIMGPGSIGVEFFEYVGFPDYGALSSFAWEAITPPAHLIYAADNTDNNLYTLDPDDAAATLIGPIGFNIVAMAFDTVTGNLIGITDTQDLILIDTTTGTGTLIGTLPTDPGTFSDICFGPDGTLYASPDNGELWLIDPTTAAIVQLLPASSLDSVAGLDFIAAGLWSVPSSTGNDTQQINPITGIGTPANPLGSYPDDNTILAASYSADLDRFFFTDLNANLCTVDLDTGAVTPVGLIWNDRVAEALAVAHDPGPAPPAPGRWIWAGASVDLGGSTFKAIMVSDDGGETWTAVDSPFDGSTGGTDLDCTATGLAQIGSLVVASGMDVDLAPTVEFAVSSDQGSTWSATPEVPFVPSGGFTTRVWSVFAAEDLGKVVGIAAQNLGEGVPPIAVGVVNGTSITWTPKSSAFDGQWAFRGCYSPSLGVMIVGGVSLGDEDMTNAVYSDDEGETWIPLSLFGGDTDVKEVVWVEELGLFIAGSGNGISTSPDGLVWTDTTNDAFMAQVQGIAWSSDQGKLAVVDASGDVWVTDDPTLPTSTGWARIIPVYPGWGFINGTQSIGYAEGRWLFAGTSEDGNVVGWSTNALVWNAAVSPYDGAPAGNLPSGFSVLHFTVTPPPPPFTGRVYADLPVRVLVTTKESRTLACLDRRSKDRQLLYTLNQPAYHTGVVASDDVEIFRPFPDADSPAALTNNRRLGYVFRREDGADPPYVCILGGIYMSIEDEAGDAASSRYTLYDAWQYMFNRPARNPETLAVIGEGGYTYPATARASEIAVEQLLLTEGIDGETHIETYGTSFPLVEETDELGGEFNIDGGTSVGEVWQALCDTGTIDIHLPPLYDPENSPGKVNQFQTVRQAIGTAAGPVRFGCVMGWDKANKSLANISRMIDGTRLANKVQFFAGSGVAAPLQTDADSVLAYGQYWAMQFFPGTNDITTVALLAVTEMLIRRNGARSIALDPAPERAELPLRDYGLGDYVPVWASENLREPLGVDFDAWDPDNPGASGYQRIFAIPIDVDDDGTVMTRGILTSKEN